MPPLKALLQSRKFWLTLIAFLVAATLFLRGQLPAENFVDATLALIAVLVTGIALEDAALKLGVKK